MKLKKLLPDLVNAAQDMGLDILSNEVQKAVLPAIKSGQDIYLFAPNGSGKSTALVMGIIQMLKAPFEEAPRAIIVTSDKEKAYELEELFEHLGKYAQVRSFVAFDHGNLQYQKDEIYDGLDVLVTNPRRLEELVNISGVPLTKVKMLLIDEAEAVMSSSHQSIIHRIADGMGKVQLIVSDTGWSKRFEALDERLMKNPLFIEFE